MPEDGEIRVAASVNQLVATRAENGSSSTETGESTSNVTPYDGTTLGLYIAPSDDNWSAPLFGTSYVFTNVKFTKNDVSTSSGSDSKWTQTQHNPMQWKDDNVDYSYYAYAPYGEGIVKDKIPYNLVDNQKDLLWVHKSGVASSPVNSNGELDIKFGHAFCMVAVELTIADEFYQNGIIKNPIKEVSISTSCSKGYIDVFSGKVYYNSENSEDEYNPVAGVLPIVNKKPESDEVAGSHTPGNITKDGTYTSPYIYYAPWNEKFVVKITTIYPKNTSAPLLIELSLTLIVLNMSLNQG